MGTLVPTVCRGVAALVVGVAMVGCAPKPDPSGGGRPDPVAATTSRPAGVSPSTTAPPTSPTSPTGPSATVPPSASTGATPSPSATSATPTTVRLSVVGDIGDGGSASAVLEGIAARQDDLTLLVGDLSYDGMGTEQQWCRFAHERLGEDHPVQIVSGNHDDDGPDGVIDAFAACLPNRLPGLVGAYGRQWYADVPAAGPVVRVVMISPGLDFGQGELSYADGTPEYRWTEEAVRSARTAGVPWVLVGMHKPCLSVGKYDCEAGPDLTNLLVREGVDLVVTGHEHFYQRTAGLALGDACPRIEPGRYEPGCLAEGEGTTFVTVGTGGASLRGVDRGDPEWPYFRAVSAAGENPAHGSLAVTVRPESLTATFEPVEGTFADVLELRVPGGP